eukprot:TRINITY_DN83003_c0_g1_i1.p1 TRINITY_DN83003_c0_g1~~TRINITY_DN83003_c0_g1_i1.p1  ORF type:complete len:389 (+),score=83.53 TRINITY_DN83003_c0_g1_i1:59-1225(+)
MEASAAGSHAATGGYVQTAEPLQRPRKSLAETLSLFQNGLKKLEAIDYSAKEDPRLSAGRDVTAAFEAFRRGAVRALHDDQIENSLVDSLERKVDILKFCNELYNVRKFWRRRVDDFLLTLLDREPWRKAAESAEELREMLARLDLLQEDAEETKGGTRVRIDSMAVNTCGDVGPITDLSSEVAEASKRGAFGVLWVKVIAAYDLINADWWSLSDPYVKVTVGNRTEQTDVIEDCLNPHWIQQPWVFDVPARNSSVRFEVWDKDTLHDDPLGDVTMPVTCLPTRISSSLRVALGSVAHGELEVEVLFNQCPDNENAEDVREAAPGSIEPGPLKISSDASSGSLVREKGTAEPSMSASAETKQMEATAADVSPDTSQSRARRSSVASME